MNRTTRKFFQSALGLALLLLLVFGLALLPRSARARESAYLETSEAYSREELAQMLAPIALYPDVLLSQVLMASTYPIEVVEADRWVEMHPELKDEALDEALLDRDWDPSVKSLCHFPSILALMSERIGETSDLGDAFLAQEGEVMDMVQELRAKAHAQGNLPTTAEQRVLAETDGIIIEPTDPRVVYVPYYDPFAVYGPWWYPAYPPGYWGPPGVSMGVGLSFWPGVYFGFSFSDWSYFDWRRRYIHIDSHKRPRYVRDDRWRYAPGRWRRPEPVPVVVSPPPPTTVIIHETWTPEPFAPPGFYDRGHDWSGGDWRHIDRSRHERERHEFERRQRERDDHDKRDRRREDRDREGRDRIDREDRPRNNPPGPGIAENDPKKRPADDPGQGKPRRDDQDKRKRKETGDERPERTTLDPDQKKGKPKVPPPPKPLEEVRKHQERKPNQPAQPVGDPTARKRREAAGSENARAGRERVEREGQPKRPGVPAPVVATEGKKPAKPPGPGDRRGKGEDVQGNAGDGRGGRRKGAPPEAISPEAAKVMLLKPAK